MEWRFTIMKNQRSSVLQRINQQDHSILSLKDRKRISDIQQKQFRENEPVIFDAEVYNEVMN